MVSDPAPIHILIVDDHRLVRQGLRMLLENNPGMKVVAEVGTPEEALRTIVEQGVDVVILDLDLGSTSGLDLIPRLLDLRKDARILILTGVRDVELHRHAIRLGAVGVVLKEQAGELLAKAIRRVHDGEIWVDRKMAATVFQELRQGEGNEPRDENRARLDSLTPREREIVDLIAEGCGTGKVASTLYISEKTVRNHLSSIYDKLGVSDRLSLALFANRHRDG